MKVGDYCKRAFIAIDAKADVAEAARVMLDKHVRFLIAYRDGDPLQKPVGVLTDRDLLLGINVARDADARAVVTVDDVMTQEPLIASEDDELSDLLQVMRLAGIRRAPVVDYRGALIGIMAIGDAIGVITGLRRDSTASNMSKQSQEWRRVS